VLDSEVNIVDSVRADNVLIRIVFWLQRMLTTRK